MKGPKPILKWVGGKTQIMEHIVFPNEIENYHEPFLGGGSVLFTLLDKIHKGEITVNEVYASDTNETLVYLYKNIQNNHHELYNELSPIIKQFNEINGNQVNRNPETLAEAKTSKESYYYFIRKMYNQLDNNRDVVASALFIFLNKTCFRGLYRVGPNGFNVPYGNNKNPEIINKQHLEEIHELIQGVIFEWCDFTIALKRVKKGDFVYLDPPYVPVNKSSFVGYTSGGFNKHQELFDILKKDEFSFIMSNSDAKIVKDNFNNYKVITAKRNINSKNPESTAKELLVFN